jgi:hypothetical protein
MTPQFLTSASAGGPFDTSPNTFADACAGVSMAL